MKQSKQYVILTIFKSGLYRCTESGDVMYSSRKYEKTLAPNYMPNGYKTYCLRMNSINYMVYGHQLVWLFFNGAYEPGNVIDHIDKDRTNNNLINLRCVTHKENLQGDWRKTIKHEWNHKVSEDQRKRIRELYNQGLSRIFIAGTLGISRQTIGKIINGFKNDAYENILGDVGFFKK